MKFSSPSGDGLVPICKKSAGSKNNFRPRVGMGWFPTDPWTTAPTGQFSSPLGVGLVLIDCSKAENYFAFSSPGGVGLVQETEFLITRSKKIFVPAWGWVGSVHARTLRIGLQQFSSPLGDGLVRKCIL